MLRTSLRASPRPIAMAAKRNQEKLRRLGFCKTRMARGRVRQGTSMQLLHEKTHRQQASIGRHEGLNSDGTWASSPWWDQADMRPSSSRERVQNGRGSACIEIDRRSGLARNVSGARRSHVPASASVIHIKRLLWLESLLHHWRLLITKRRSMASPSFASQRIPRAAPHRSFTLPPRLQDPTKEQALADQLPSSTIETLYEHPSAKIVCFSVPLPRSTSTADDHAITTPEQSPAGVLSWRADREWTVASGLAHRC